MRAGVGLLTIAAALLSSCAGIASRRPPIEVWDDMDRQGKLKAQEASPLFADGRATRLPVAGTIAVGQLREDGYHNGLMDGLYVGRNPLKLDAATLELGQVKFNTYCSPCHDRTGSGKGIVSLRSNAALQAADLRKDEIKAYTDGEIFWVISNGRRTMGGYRNQIPARDRWAITAYVRALQRTTTGSMDDVPADRRAAVK
jgi:mono/diheme cytochrome c family protein